MKHLYVFLLVVSLNYFGYAQFHEFQLVLVDSNIGSELYVGCEGCGNASNDEGLNNIFQNHNVGYYQSAYVYSSFLEDLNEAINVGSCNGCDINQLIQDLNEYDSVIQIASITNEDYFFNHGLSLKLVNDSIGIPIGETNGVISTNNSDLNQIFTDFNVSTYQLVDSGTSYERFELFCNCDAMLLKQELEMISSIVLSTEYMYMSVLLSIQDDIETKVNIHPNPFKDKVSVEFNKPLENILLFDILGKQVYESSSIVDFESFTLTLKSGVYLLKLVTSNGETMTKKLIKT